MNRKETPAGRYVQKNHSSGPYYSFIPNPLPPKLCYSDKLVQTAMKAQQVLSKLTLEAARLPDVNAFIECFIQREAEYSCQVEGTIASYEDVLKEDAGMEGHLPGDTDDIRHYFDALETGIKILKSSPDTEISEWFVRRLHEELIKHHPEKNPGQYKSGQNQIGGVRNDPASAEFVPPDALESLKAMGDLARFIKDDVDFHALMHVGLVHAQFETIHPFEDGNGRVGRILITMQLIKKGVIDHPFLYLSFYFKRHKDRYTHLLQAVHEEGAWEEWLMFFFEGIIETCHSGLQLTSDIQVLIRKSLATIGQHFSSQRKSEAEKLLYKLFKQPIIRAKDFGDNSTAYRYFNDFAAAGLIRIIESRGSKIGVFSEYYSILNRHSKDDHP